MAALMSKVSARSISNKTQVEAKQVAYQDINNTNSFQTNEKSRIIKRQTFFQSSG